MVIQDELSQLDGTLNDKMIQIESMAEDLTPEFISSMNISEFVDKEIRHFLVHRLEGGSGRSSSNPSELQ